MKINTFEKLEEYLKAFNDGEINLLIIKSDGGLGKSFTVRKMIQDAIIFKGHSTPLSIYLRLSKHPLKKIVFDDVDTLFNNKTTIALLKQICDTEKDKVIRYDTTFKGAEDFKEEFISNNRVVLLCNDIKRMGKNIKALLTRGIFIDFRPSHDSVLEKLNIFAEDEEVFNYLKEKKNEIDKMNFRIYHNCCELKESGINWKEYLASEYSLNTDSDLVEEIMHLPKNDRNSLWVRETGKSIRALQRNIRSIKAKRQNDTLKGMCVQKEDKKQNGKDKNIK